MADSVLNSGFRNYFSSYGQGSVAFNQLYDSTLVLTNVYDGSVIGTGGWRPITPADFSEVIISGATVSVGSVALTGSPNVTLNDGTVKVAITGTQGIMVNGGYIGLTGQPIVVNAAVTGAPVFTITGNPTIYTTPAPIAPMAAVTVSGTNTFSSVTGIALQANASRRKAYIQNISSGSVLWVGYGFGPSTGAANILLKAASADNAGDGGSLIEDSFTGALYVSGVTRFIAWQA